MKKFAIYGLTAMLSMAFVACDNYEEPNPAPQTNAPDAVLQTSDVTLTDALAGTQDLSALYSAGQEIKAASIACNQLGEGYSFKAVAQVSANDFASSFDVPTTVVLDTVTNTYDVMIAPGDLQETYYNNISKSPRTREIKVRYALYTVSGGQEARIGGADNVYGPYTMSVTPYPSTIMMEENYYLLGTINGWDVATAVKMNHSDANVYDDPVFTLKVDITPEEAAAGWWWKIVPQSTYETGNWVDAANGAYGVAENGAEDLSGMLVPRTATEDCGAGCLKVSGPYLLTINLEEGTYAFSLAIENLYTPGNSNGWSQTASQMLYTSNYADYMGYAHLNGEFKFTSQPDWNGINFGFGGEEGKLSNDGGAGNINAGADGLYWCNANISSLTYSLDPVTTIGLIGDATPGAWDASTAMTPSEDFLTWTVDVEFGAGQFKFRANDAWDINLGGSMDNLTQGGDNINAPAAGKYRVTLNLGSLPYTCTVTAL